MLRSTRVGEIEMKTGWASRLLSWKNLLNSGTLQVGVEMECLVTVSCQRDLDISE